METNKTQIVINKINELSEGIYKGMCTEGEIYKEIAEARDKNRVRLKQMLSEVVEKSPELGEYIYQYIYINQSNDAKPHPDTSNYYNGVIREAFRQNGFNVTLFSGEESENPEKENQKEVERIITHLKKSAICADRTVMFELAFGLNMDGEMVEEMLKKALMQQGINAKDYREVIYWWCLNNEFQDFENPTNKCKKAKELIEAYNDIDKLEKLASEWQKRSFLKMNDNVNTVLLLEKLKKIKEEGQLYYYLYTLKKADLKVKKSVTMVRAYRELIRDLPREDVEYTNPKLRQYLSNILEVEKDYIDELMTLIASETGTVMDSSPAVYLKSNTMQKLKNDGINLTINQIERIQKLILDEEQDYAGHSSIDDENDLYNFICDEEVDSVTESARKRIQSTMEKKLEIVKNEVSNGLYKEDLLPKSVAEKLFADFDITERVLRTRLSLNEKVRANRKDIIFLYFLDETVGLLEEELFEKQSREISVDDFIDEASVFLENRNLYPIYLRNPFDLFLIVCLLHDDPFKYFMANWALAVEK